MDADAGSENPENGERRDPHRTAEEDARARAEFAALHGPALRASGVPERYWGRLLHKLEHEVRAGEPPAGRTGAQSGAGGAGARAALGPSPGKGVAAGGPLAESRGGAARGGRARGAAGRPAAPGTTGAHGAGRVSGAGGERAPCGAQKPRPGCDAPGACPCWDAAGETHGGGCEERQCPGDRLRRRLLGGLGASRLWGLRVAAMAQHLWPRFRQCLGLAGLCVRLPWCVGTYPEFSAPLRPAALSSPLCG